VIVVRFAWFLGNEYVPGLPLVSGADSAPNWRRALVAAWSGLRGAVSLAAALAIPVTTLSGAPVPQRELIIFLTFSVIVVTLVGGGLTLPLVIARLHIPSSDDEDEAEIRTALAAMLSAATSYIDGMVLRSERRLRAHDADARRELTLDQERQVVEEERATLISLRNRGEIDNTILRKLQYKLDLADAALPPRETEEG
jgi:CPA1 family monovalent cation:H+ antiporter